MKKYDSNLPPHIRLQLVLPNRNTLPGAPEGLQRALMMQHVTNLPAYQASVLNHTHRNVPYNMSRSSPAIVTPSAPSVPEKKVNRHHKRYELDELRAHLLRFRQPGPHRFPFAIIAREARCSRQELYEILNGGECSLEQQILISRVIQRINDRTLRAERIAQKWLVTEHERPVSLVVQDRYALPEHHNEWAKCQRCSGTVWLHVTRNDREMYVCETCFPEKQWPFEGVKLITKGKR